MVTDLYPKISVIRMQADSPTERMHRRYALTFFVLPTCQSSLRGLKPHGGRAGGQARMAYGFENRLRINFWAIHPYLYYLHLPNRLQKL